MTAVLTIFHTYFHQIDLTHSKVQFECKHFAKVFMAMQTQNRLHPRNSKCFFEFFHSICMFVRADTNNNNNNNKYTIMRYIHRVESLKFKICNAIDKRHANYKQ